MGEVFETTPRNARKLLSDTTVATVSHQRLLRCVGTLLVPIGPWNHRLLLVPMLPLSRCEFLTVALLVAPPVPCRCMDRKNTAFRTKATRRRPVRGVPSQRSWRWSKPMPHTHTHTHTHLLPALRPVPCCRDGLFFFQRSGAPDPDPLRGSL